MAVPPLVVVVMVANDPGDWFEESLQAIVASDYPNFSVIIVDNGSRVTLAQRVGASLPNALFLRNETNLGFSAAVDAAVRNVTSATYLMICHDDAAVAPDAISIMVEDALRMNASIVAPKIVSWSYPDRITSLGFDVDRTAALRSRIDVGDLDQDQFPIVEEVFAAPGAAMLVRYDLFNVLGGFDPEIYLFGEDVELSYRAQLAGARVIASSYAKVRHMGVLVNGVDGAYVNSKFQPIRRKLRRAERSYYVRANQMRCIVNNSSGFARRYSKIQLWLLALLEAAYFAVSGRWRTARAILKGLRDGAKKSPTQSVRWEVGAQSRLLDFRDMTLKLARGSARLSAFFAHQRNTRAQIRYEVERSKRNDRGAFLEKENLSEDAIDPTSLATRYVQRRFARVIQGLILVFILVAGRHVLFSNLPVFGQFEPFPHGTSLLSDFFSGSLSSSTISPTSVPAGYLWLGVIGTFFFGATGLFYHLFLIGLVATGLFGAFRLGARYRNPLSASIAMLSYFSTGILTGLISVGTLFGLVTFAFAPWILGIVLDFQEELAPGSKIRARSFFRGAFIVAIATSIAPAFFIVFLILTLAVIASTVFERHSMAQIRSMLRFLFGIAGVALVANATWFLGYLHSGATVASLFGAQPPFDLAVRSIFNFSVSGGAMINSFAILSLLSVILSPIFTRGLRTRRSIRALILAIVFVAFIIGSNGGGFGSDPIPLAFLMPFLAAIVAYSTANGVDGLYRDLPRETFGVRQIAGALSIIGLLVASFGVGAPISGGRLGLPVSGYGSTLGWSTSSKIASSRLLWIGDPAAIPAGSWWFDSGVGLAVTNSHSLSFENVYTPIQLGKYGGVQAGLARASSFETIRLGSFLASEGIGNLIYPQSGVSPAVARVTLTLSRQKDLIQVLTDPSVTGYVVHGRKIARFPPPHGPSASWPLFLGSFEVLVWLGFVDLVFGGGFISSRVVTRVRVSLATQRDQRNQGASGIGENTVENPKSDLEVHR